MGSQLSCDVTATVFFWLIKEGLMEGEDTAEDSHRHWMS